jgi:RNA polymerase sigma-70 factor, ECF subfamily
LSPAATGVASDATERENEPATSHATHDTVKSMRKSSSRSDVELLRAFQEGDEQAFAELYVRHKSEVYTYCLRMVDGDPDVASDAFQEVWIKVYEKGSTFRDGSNVMGWLYMVARNTCLNVHRAKKPNDSLDNHAGLVSRDRALTPEFDHEQSFLREVLEQSIAKLPMEFREPFILREFDGFSYQEIADMTGTTLAITKVRIHRAKQKMREFLKPYVREEVQSEGQQRVLNGSTVRAAEG